MADALFYDPAGPLECKVTDIPRLKTIDCGQGRSHVISGQVVGVHIRRHCVVAACSGRTDALPVTRAAMTITVS